MKKISEALVVASEHGVTNDKALVIKVAAMTVVTAAVVAATAYATEKLINRNESDPQ